MALFIAFYKSPGFSWRFTPPPPPKLRSFFGQNNLNSYAQLFRLLECLQRWNTGNKKSLWPFVLFPPSLLFIHSRLLFLISSFFYCWRADSFKWTSVTGGCSEWRDSCVRERDIWNIHHSSGSWLFELICAHSCEELKRIGNLIMS